MPHQACCCVWLCCLYRTTRNITLGRAPPRCEPPTLKSWNLGSVPSPPSPAHTPYCLHIADPSIPCSPRLVACPFRCNSAWPVGFVTPQHHHFMPGIALEGHIHFVCFVQCAPYITERWDGRLAEPGSTSALLNLYIIQHTEATQDNLSMNIAEVYLQDPCPSTTCIIIPLFPGHSLLYTNNMSSVTIGTGDREMNRLSWVFKIYCKRCVCVCVFMFRALRRLCN